jgi:hypothetical protein
MNNQTLKRAFDIFDKNRADIPETVDLTDVALSDLVTRIADELVNLQISDEQTSTIEDELIQKDKDANILLLLALKMARSKRIIEDIKAPIKVSVVFGMYKEHNRIKSSAEHPHGEDFLRRKVAQLKWLFEGCENFNWDLIVVDDGCPEDCGKIAQQIVEEEQLGDRVKVLFMQEAINQQLPTVVGMTSTNESQKGGSIAYGMWYASQENSHEHNIIVFTDADLSTHLGQVGLLVEPLINQEKLVAIGSRREAKSVVIKQGARNNRGKLFIYLWKRLLPELNEIIDTQCGFKAFRGELVSQIIQGLIEKKFAFDIELLLKSELLAPGSISKVAIAWIDSEAASTTTDIQPYLPMLQAIVKMYRKYLPGNEQSDAFASFIEELDVDAFNHLLDHIPAGILEREPIEFSAYDGVSVEMLKEGIRG